MDRLNSELEFRIYGDKSDEIIKPYSNGDHNNFKDNEVTITGFTNRQNF